MKWRALQAGGGDRKHTEEMTFTLKEKKKRHRKYTNGGMTDEV